MQSMCMSANSLSRLLELDKETVGSPVGSRGE